MTEAQIARTLALAGVIRELKAYREELQGQLHTFDDYCRRGGAALLRFGMVVLGASGEFWMKDAYVIGEIQRAARTAFVARIADVDRRLKELEFPTE